MSKVDPNAILSIFLPCLIFESGFKTEWHIFKKLAGQSLIIGVLSSLVGASLIMVLIKTFISPDVLVPSFRLTPGVKLCCWEACSLVQTYFPSSLSSREEELPRRSHHWSRESPSSITALASWSSSLFNTTNRPSRCFSTGTISHYFYSMCLEESPSE